MAFLAPTTHEKQQLAAAAELRKLAQDKSKKLAAAERKRKREEDAARVASITDALRETRDRRVVASERKENKVRDDAISEWLDKGRFFGTSRFSSKDLVKALCGEAGDRIYDPEKKCFGTKVMEFLPRLVKSFVWVPVGLPEQWIEPMLVEAAKRVDNKLLKTEAVSMVKRENAEQAVHANVMTFDDREDKIRRRGMVQKATAEELEQVTQLGFCSAAIDESPSFPDLGPTSGLSTEARLVRFVEAAVYAVTCSFEFTRTDACVVREAEAQARNEIVCSLNRRAAASATACSAMQ